MSNSLPLCTISTGHWFQNICHQSSFNFPHGNLIWKTLTSNCLPFKTIFRKLWVSCGRVCMKSVKTDPERYAGPSWTAQILQKRSVTLSIINGDFNEQQCLFIIDAKFWLPDFWGSSPGGFRRVGSESEAKTPRIVGPEANKKKYNTEKIYVRYLILLYDFRWF